MESALGFNYTSPMILVMKEVKYESIEDIVTMDQEEAMKLSYGVVNSQDSVTIEVHLSPRRNYYMSCGCDIMTLHAGLLLQMIGCN